MKTQKRKLSNKPSNLLQRAVMSLYKVSHVHIQAHFNIADLREIEHFSDSKENAAFKGSGCYLIRKEGIKLI